MWSLPGDCMCTAVITEKTCNHRLYIVEGLVEFMFLQQPHQCNSVWLLCIHIIIEPIQNPYYNASITTQLKSQIEDDKKFNGYLQLWLLSLIRSTNSHVGKKRPAFSTVWKCFEQCFITNTRVTNSLQAHCSGFVASDYSVTYFFIKSSPSHTFPRALQSVTQTERVHVSLPIYAPLFTPRSSPSCNAGMVDSCLLIQCHGLFPLSVCLDVTISGIIGWVSASVSRPTADIRTLTPWSSWSFPGMSHQFELTITMTYKTAWKSILSLDVQK